MIKTLADFILKEEKRLNEFVYSSLPYPCGITEAMHYLKKYIFPETSQIVREKKQTKVYFKQLKDSKKKKKLSWLIWIA